MGESVRGFPTMKKICILVFLLISLLGPIKVEAFSTNIYPIVLPKRVVGIPDKKIYDFRDFIKRNPEDVYFGDDYPCEINVVPNLITMKRVLLNGQQAGKRDEGMRNWQLSEWARQLTDLERYLSFCNRRNSVSKIRLF